MDFGTLIISILFTLALYVGLPLLICTAIKSMWGKRPYKTVIAVNALVVLILVFYVKFMTEDLSTINATAAVLWSYIAYVLLVKIHGKPPKKEKDKRAESDASPRVEERNRQEPKSRATTITLAAACVILMVAVIWLANENKMAGDRNSALAAKVDEITGDRNFLQSDMERLATENVGLKMTSERWRADTERWQNNYNNVRKHAQAVEEALWFYYTYCGLLDGDGEKYYHRYGVDCSEFAKQKTCYIYHVDGMPRRAEPCPFCYSTEADILIDGLMPSY